MFRIVFRMLFRVFKKKKPFHIESIFVGCSFVLQTHHPKTRALKMLQCQVLRVCMSGNKWFRASANKLKEKWQKHGCLPHWEDEDKMAQKGLVAKTRTRARNPILRPCLPILGPAFSPNFRVRPKSILQSFFPKVQNPEIDFCPRHQRSTQVTFKTRLRPPHWSPQNFTKFGISLEYTVEGLTTTQI